MGKNIKLKGTLYTPSDGQDQLGGGQGQAEQGDRGRQAAAQGQGSTFQQRERGI